MALKLLVTFWCLCVIIGYIAQGTAEFAPPHITFPDSSEHIIDTGDSIIFYCEGKREITWTFPALQEGRDHLGFHVIPANTTDTIYIYGSHLRIENATYLDTGFYYCHDINTNDLNDVSKVSSFYLYVADDEHLAVNNEPIGTVVATQYTDAVIPCRPTSPEVIVDLSRLTGEEKINNLTFDPKVGFTFPVSDINQQEEYTCTFIQDNNTYEVYFFLVVTPMTDSLAKPVIEDLNKGHSIVGQPLRIKCTVRTHVRVAMIWVVPRNESYILLPMKKESTDMISQELYINKTTNEDGGQYSCIVKNSMHENNNTIFIRIFDTDEHFIKLFEDNGVYYISVLAGEPIAQWAITVEAHPVAILEWFKNINDDMELIAENNAKYEISTSPKEAILKIKDISIFDYGNYTLKAKNEFEEAYLTLFLNVTDKPTVEIETDDYHLIHKESTIKCIVAAHPEPSIYWYFKGCQDDSCEYEMKTEWQSQQNGLKFTSYLNISSNQSGFVKCVAINSVGNDSSTAGYFVSDVENGFNIWGYEDEVPITAGTRETVVGVGSSVKLHCAASVYNYSRNINWYKNLIPLNDDGKHYNIEKSNTEFSNRIVLSINKIIHEDEGTYNCKVWDKETVSEHNFSNITIIVSEIFKPIINVTNMKKDFSIAFPGKVDFYCKPIGIPKPIITWYKNNVVWTPSNNRRISLKEENQKLVFEHTDVTDEGTYRCEAKNRIGTVYKEVTLSFTNKATPTYAIILIIIVIVIFAIGFMIAMFFLIKKNKESRDLQRVLKKLGLENFEEGAIENLNPELGLDDQAELLPYDRKWEFPVEKLKLGKQLGSGAFGVVLKAQVYGIIDGEESTTVAVKMVKRNADFSYIKALASELKIMLHLGKHLNVVNLLGACTKNVIKHELMVIVEYCRFGNLHNYLLRHRDDFINQIDSNTGKIDYNTGAEILERTFSVSSDRSNSQSPQVKYVALSFSHNSNAPGGRNNEMADYRENSSYSGNTANTETTTVCMTPSTEAEDGMALSNNSIQPEWRSNYRGDYKGNVKPICTKDLVTWIFQIARGMEYLASRRVLHGDLAARNILLADGGIIKICDFGLAKNMYKSDNYKKRGDCPLPIKWMAVESIRDRVFSTQSDIWSFGIVLWELFSLARTPYPGMQADERLYSKLLDGYRMDAPEFAPKEIYQMMLDCWQAEPTQRPSFTLLCKRIGNMLEENVRRHYIDLNDPYLVMNTQRFVNSENDYLAMLSPPNFENLSSPHDYINDLPFNHHPAEPVGYVCMKQNNHIFSPREADENIFTFENLKKAKNGTSEPATGTELLPMLQNESDSEQPNSPLSPNSVSNPTYHLPPLVNSNAGTDILKSSDNYVNMPKNKSALADIRTVETNSGNVRFELNEKSSDRHYVNDNSRDWEKI